MDATGLGVDEVGKRVQVGVLELRELPPALDLRDDLVLVADLGEHACVGREAGLAPPLLRQSELLEQDRSELLRRADHELVTGEFEDLALELVDPLRHSLADLGQALVSSLTPARSMAASTSISGISISAIRRSSPNCVELLALSRRELEGQAGLGRRVGGRLAPRRRARAARVSVVAVAPSRPPSQPRRARCSDAGVGGELGELVDATGRVDQVGGDHGVVSEVEAAGRRDGEQARRGRRRPATWRRGAIAAVRELFGEGREVVRVARYDQRSPSLPAQRPSATAMRDRAGRQVGRGSLHRIDHERLLDGALGDVLARTPRRGAA